MSLDELYQSLLLDHSKHPRCHGTIDSPDKSVALYNPLCGDRVRVDMRFDPSNTAHIKEVKFCGEGCSISQASASIMAELCNGKSVEEARHLEELFRAMMRGEKTAEECVALGDAGALEGVKRFAARMKCALLPWEALHKCIESR